jgi:hypothetical protein
LQLQEFFLGVFFQDRLNALVSFVDQSQQRLVQLLKLGNCLLRDAGLAQFLGSFEIQVHVLCIADFSLQVGSLGHPGNQGQHAMDRRLLQSQLVDHVDLA